MIILNQDETAIYYLEKMATVYVDLASNTIYALLYASNMAFPLGKYKNVERAKEVVKEIFCMSNLQEKYDMPIV